MFNMRRAREKVVAAVGADVILFGEESYLGRGRRKIKNRIHLSSLIKIIDRQNC